MDKSDGDNLIKLCLQLKEQCRLCHQTTELTSSPNHYIRSKTADALRQRLMFVYKLLNETEFMNHLININLIAGQYDYEDIPANGFRTFLALVSSCLIKILFYLRKLDHRTFFLWSAATEEYLIAYLECFEELAFCIILISQFPKFCDSSHTLFPRSCYTNLLATTLPSHDNLGPPLCTLKPLMNLSNARLPTVSDNNSSTYSTFIDCFDLIKQDVFFGRPIGFYLDTPAQTFSKIFASLMIGFNASYQNALGGVSGFLNSVIYSVTSFISPEERGSRIAHISRSADVHFFKCFFNLFEYLYVNAVDLLVPKMAVCYTFRLPNVPVTLETKPTDDSSPSTVTINPPSGGKGISVRLISKVRRRGMTWALSQEQVEWRTNATTRKRSLLRTSLASVASATSMKANPSPFLIVHIHGGGFISLSSESQDGYIRPWADKLDCPVISLNYSLAPESPYPRALDECFHAVCWVMANRERLGSLPDAKVVVCGDSAGGCLSLGICLRAAALGLRATTARPVGALIAYAPLVMAYVPSPSRMMSICDPILLAGTILSSVTAYTGVSEMVFNRPASMPESALESKDHPSEKYKTPLWSRLWYAWFPSSLPSVSPLTSSLERLHATSRCRITLNGPQDNVTTELPLQGCSNDSTFDSLSSPHPPAEFQDAEEKEVDERLKSLTEADNEKKHYIESMRRFRKCRIPQDPFISPYLASDELLRLLPPLAIMAAQYDPFLDDSVELAKRLKAVGVPVELSVAIGKPHAFLNMGFFGSEYYQAVMHGAEMIERLFRYET